jgi:TonB family protein
MKYLPIAATCVALFFGSCKNETKNPVSTAIQADTTAMKSTAANAQATADSIAAAEAAALAAAKQDSIAKAAAVAEAATKDKKSKTATKPTTKPATKANPKGQTTATLPKPTAKPAVPTPPKKDGNIKKRTGKDDVFTISEVKPMYPGGDAAMMKYLQKNIKYPIQAKEQGVKGTVFMRFVVEKDGSVTDVEVAKGVNPLLDTEAKRVVSSMPKWAPGKQNGTNVAVQYTLPVKFDLVE